MTYIITTLGPASFDKQTLISFWNDGVRILRFNFPHFTYKYGEDFLKVIKDAEQEIDGKFELLLDTEGPGIRTGKLETPIKYKKGDTFKIVTREHLNTESNTLYCDYTHLEEDLEVGKIVKIDSGLFDVKVLERYQDYMIVKALNTAIIGSRRHINLPGTHVSLPGLSDKDKQDVLRAIKHNFDHIAMSFVRNKEDIQDLRNFLTENRGEKIHITAKIENFEGIDNADDIINTSDMTMIARGDLGVELPIETIPTHQLELIKKTKSANKPVIVATQMLESMIDDPVPTRAEVTDIFYAVTEGADYTMLSGETAIGKFPVKCTEMMNKVIKEATKKASA